MDVLDLVWDSGDEDVVDEDTREVEIRRTLEISRDHPFEKFTVTSAPSYFASCPTLRRDVICHTAAGKAVALIRIGSLAAAEEGVGRPQK